MTSDLYDPWTLLGGARSTEPLGLDYECTVRRASPTARLMLDLSDGGEPIGSIRALRDTARADDLPARVGGDEFAVILPGTSLQQRADKALYRAKAAGRAQQST